MQWWLNERRLCIRLCVGHGWRWGFENKRKHLCPQGVHSLNAGNTQLYQQPQSSHSRQSTSLCFVITEDRAPTTMGFPAEGTEQNFEAGIALKSMRTNRARTVQREKQASQSRSQTDRGTLDVCGSLWGWPRDCGQKSEWRARRACRAWVTDVSAHQAIEGKLSPESEREASRIIVQGSDDTRFVFWTHLPLIFLFQLPMLLRAKRALTHLPSMLQTNLLWVKAYSVGIIFEPERTTL